MRRWLALAGLQARPAWRRCVLARSQWSVSDVVLWSQSPFAAWMERLAKKDATWLEQRDEVDEMDLLLAAKGREWERECLTQMGEGVLYQERAWDDLLVGAADFLIPTPQGYEIWDAKLASNPRPAHILQLCCYAELWRDKREISPRAGLLLKTRRYEVDLALYTASYRRLRSRFEVFAADFDRHPLRIPKPAPPVENHGRWRTLAAEMLKNDVGSVYGVTRRERRRLVSSGVETIQDLAQRPGKLGTQARMQLTGGYRVLKKTKIPPRPERQSDVYLDLEGDPFSKLEYLWGFYYEGKYQAEWAHDAAGEQAALRHAMDLFRRSEAAGGTCYHYGAYELSALRRLVAGTLFEEELEDFVRRRYFVDLYVTVKRSLVIGQPKYSLKNVEKLYRKETREGIRDAVSSVVGYEVYLCTGDVAILDQLQAYNKDDCVSTWQLATWLRDVLGTEPKPSSIATSVEKNDPIPTEESSLCLPETCLGWLEYHRRENRPLWRQRFEWFEATAGELCDDEKCVGDCSLFEVIPGKRSSEYVYGFPPQATRVAVGDRVTVFGDDEGRVSAAVTRVEPTVVAVKTSKDVPRRCSMIPDEFVNPEPLPTTIARNIRDMSPALRDLVERRDPDVDRELFETARKTADVDDIAEAIVTMRSTTVAIQGPPGTGKTYCAARALRRLMDEGFRVGVTAPSHNTIENLLQQVGERTLKVGGTSKTKKIPAKITACVGATAWALAAAPAETFDFVVVDEAGQFPAANLCAIAAATKNLVLVGDHHQLPAPTRASHPANAGDSCLDHLARRRDYPKIFLKTTRRLHPKLCTVVSDLFYASHLEPHEQTRQYTLEGPRGGVVDARAGLYFVEVVDDSANSIATANLAEARAVAFVVDDLLSHRTFQGRPLAQEDVLVVAPYNAHARACRDALAGHDRVRVGTVDKFQGKQAPVVVASICSANDDRENDEAAEATRGMSFALDRRRLNVAISRAQALAVVVASPHVADAAFGNSIDAMARLSLFAALRERAQGVYRYNDDDNVSTATFDVAE